MNVSHKSYRLKFRHPFTISKGTKTHQPTFVVKLEHFGITGFGEAPAISYYNIPVEKMAEDLERKKGMVEKFAFTDPERFWHFCHHLFPDNSFLVCALDIAGWDLYAKMKNKPLWKLWMEKYENAPVTDYTIAIDSIENMVKKAKEKPWPVYKIKLGTAEDIAIAETLKKETDAVLRVDANAGWTVTQALNIIPELERLSIELVEQPLAKDDFKGMMQLQEKFSIPFYADESCVSEKDVEKCAGVFNGINIKLTKCGGITPALRMIKNAGKLGMQIMIGCMNESTIGSAAIAHLAPLADHIDMDGPLLLEEDIATGLMYDFGNVKLSNEPGLGVHILEDFE